MNFRQLYSRIALLLCAFLCFGINSIASHTPDTHEDGGFNASEVIFGHIRDAHDWHLFDVNGHAVSVPLPVIIYSKDNGVSVFSSARFGHHGHRSVYKGYTLDDESGKIISGQPGEVFYDLSITKNVASLLLSVVLMLWIMTRVAAKYKKAGATTAPSGFQNALETAIIFVRDEVAKPNLGHKYMRFMPLLLTMFFFIWINNILGLIPGGANFTGNIAVTGCLALITFIVMVAKGNKHFWGHLFNPPGVPLGIKFLLVPIEIISLFIKPIALMIRLFANMLAGHIIILSIISMIFIFGALSTVAGWSFAPVSLAFTIFMFFLELLVGAIQAFIFTNLTAVFIGQSVDEGHAHEADPAHH